MSYDYEKYQSSKSLEEEMEICNKRSQNVPIKEILKKHDISRPTLYRIVKKHMGKEYPYGRKLTETDVKQFVCLWNDCVPQSKISEQFGVSQTMVSQIIRRKTRKTITDSLWIRDNTQNDFASVNVIYNC